MELTITADEQAVVEQALRTSRRVRDWRRYQAVLLVAQGQHPQEVGRLLRVSRASVYNWIAAWRAEKAAGLHERPPSGRWHLLNEQGHQWLDALLSSTPEEHGYQASGWTVPLLLRAAEQAGYVLSGRTLRRAIHRLGWRWKRPRYVLGRPDPDYAQKKSS